MAHFRKKEFREKIKWYLASLDLALQAALVGIRHQYPKTSPWRVLKCRWHREDEDRQKANIRMIRSIINAQRKAT